MERTLGIIKPDAVSAGVSGQIIERILAGKLRVVAMKILGGEVEQGARLSGDAHYESAVRYALGIPGLSVAIMGMKNVAELKKAVSTVKAYKPFSGGEISKLNQKGKLLAKDWGELRGPVV